MVLSQLLYAIWNSGALCIATAALIYSVAAALVRPLSPEISVLEIVAIRSAISLGFSFAVARTQGIAPLFGQPKNMRFLALRGLVGAAAMDCFYMAIQRLHLGEAISLMFINPALTALLAWPLLGEPLNAIGIAGCAASLIGMVLVVQPPALFGSAEGWSGARAVGVGFGLASALLAAGAYLAIRVIGGSEPPLTIAVWFHSAALVHSALLLPFGWPAPAVWPTPKDWACLFGIACSSFTANILLNRGFSIESAALASGVNYSQVVYSSLIGWLVFGERPKPLGVAGAALIAAGIMGVAVATKANKKKAGETDGRGQEVELTPEQEEQEKFLESGGASKQTDSR